MADTTKGSVTITSRSRAALTISLPHDLCCSDEECHCSRELHGSIRYDGVEGTRHVKGGKKRIPKSFTLLALGRLEGLPASVEMSPDVVANRASIEITRLDADQTAKQAAKRQEAEKKDAETAKQTAAFLEEKRRRKAGIGGEEAPSQATDPGAARAASEDALRSQAESAAPAKRSKSA
jgi:hypothetical protein